MAGKTSKAGLYTLAESQQGLFTARQAVSAGYDRRNHSYHIARRNWVHEARGIYRLSQFPRSSESDYVLWSLWSMGESTTPAGVLSHETAMLIHKLSDVLPAKIHLTIPRDFGSREVPAVLVLHRSDLALADVESRTGYQVTTVLRTLLDVAGAQTLAPDLLEQAIVQALERGTLTMAQVQGHELLRKHLPEVQRYRDAEPLTKVLKMFLTPPPQPTPEYEQSVRKAAVLIQQGLESLGEWLSKPRPENPARKLLKRGLRGDGGEGDPSAR